MSAALPLEETGVVHQEERPVVVSQEEEDAGLNSLIELDQTEISRCWQTFAQKEEAKHTAETGLEHFETYLAERLKIALSKVLEDAKR
jgi:spore cortex formation protein SpoVR/YcgB (stage V sporulation)